MNSVFSGYKFSVQERPDELFLSNVSVFVGEQLIYSGLKHGNKVKNKITIPSWIFKKKSYLIRFIRGFFDTDGCVYNKYGPYAQIQIKLACEETVKSIRDALIILRFNPTKIQRELYAGLYSWKVYLVRQDEIKRFFREISPMNHKHQRRFKEIMAKRDKYL